MVTRTRIEPLDRTFALALAEDLAPEARSRQFAAFAQEEIDKAAAANRDVIGREPARKIFVDGREGAPLETVSPTGTIVATFELFGEVVEWIAEELVKASPVRSGRFARSHIILADGVEADPGNIPEARSYTFVNTQPYARKIERGLSPQATDGVYEVIAALAQSRFGNMARIRFTFQSPLFVERRSRSGGQAKAERASRAPAIVVSAF